MTLRIGLVGDLDARITAHRAIPASIALAADILGVSASTHWLPTPHVTPAALAACDGLWCVPGSPYQSMARALAAIRHARVTPRPFLGTCGGFQHAVIEFARAVVGWGDADHAESAPNTPRAVIAPLACALIESTEVITLQAGTRIAAAYGGTKIRETYHCRYGIDGKFTAALVAHGLVVSGTDESGAVRAVELPEHPFFVATLFQPERAALKGVCPPLAAAFIAQCARHGN